MEDSDTTAASKYPIGPCIIIAIDPNLLYFVVE
jgi:hypothetical protein